MRGPNYGVGHGAFAQDLDSPARVADEEGAMNLTEERILGRSGLTVGRLGVSCGYGAPTEAFEEAFERGCNYFNWGTFIKGRSREMRDAIRNLVRRGHREDLIIAMLTYAHSPLLTEIFFRRGRKARMKARHGSRTSSS